MTRFKCPDCNGDGVVLYAPFNPSAKTDYVECGLCKGDGEFEAGRLVAHVRLLANLLGFDLTPLAPDCPQQPITSRPGFDGRKQAAVGMGEENLGGCK